MKTREEAKQVVINYTDTESPNRLIVNHHKHPEIGGTGHISMRSVFKNETIELSVYPNSAGILSRAIAALSFYILPINAANKSMSHDHAGCSPITSTYEIPAAMLTDHESAHNEIKEIAASIESGTAAFSITPNQATKVIHAVTSPHVSTMNIYLGLKVYDREKIDSELEKIDVINCSSSAARVLVKGGIQEPEGIFGYQTPSKINNFFKDNLPNIHNETNQHNHSSQKSLEAAIRKGFDE